MQNDINKPRRSAPAATAKETIQNQDEPIEINEADLEPAKAPKGPGMFARLKAKWNSLSRRRKNLSIFCSIVLVALVAVVLSLIGHHSKIPNAQTAAKHPTKNTVASPLTGVQVNPLLAKRPVTGIMIENSDDARPQSGLQDAGVVYEAIAEAGITRFLALFQESTPQYIGPVRSLRPYYIDFAAPFEASIVHVGGSPDALNEVTNGSFRNLDQFYNGSYFTRVSSRAAPHNVYTSFNQLDQLNQSKGFTSSQFSSWPRKADKKLAKPTATKIDMSISGADFNVHYDYDAASNSYLRSEGEAAHMDLVNASDTAGVQLKPKVVVALVMSLSNGALDASGAYYSNYITTGSGSMYVFQDGGVTQGTWSKSGTTDQFKFTDSKGQPIKLDAGQTWITIVQGGQLNYAP